MKEFCRGGKIAVIMAMASVFGCSIQHGNKDINDIADTGTDYHVKDIGTDYHSEDTVQDTGDGRDICPADDTYGHDKECFNDSCRITDPGGQVCSNKTCDAGEGCGTCPGDCACAQGQVCFNNACCTPDCSNRQCGEDGCGHSCGQCKGDEYCDNGTCKPSECGHCKDEEVCMHGKCKNPWCEGAVKAICYPGKAGDIAPYANVFCADAKGSPMGIYKWCWHKGCHATGKSGMDAAGCNACTPKTGECGPDGCGHSIGTCASGKFCHAGKCLPNSELGKEVWTLQLDVVDPTDPRSSGRPA